MATRSEKGKWIDEKDKREGLKSLFYFGKFILGYELEYNPHKEVCDFIQNIILHWKKGLVLVPRGTYKTTIMSQILPLWLIVRNPNVRILLDSQVLRNSERNLGVIKGQIEHNPRLQRIYGFLKDKERWTQSEITVVNRTNYALKEPTVGTSSLDTVEVGPHWDYILPDDLHNEKNTKTKEQIDFVYEHWRLMFSLLEPNGAMGMVGTRWADLDVYGRIIEDHKDFKVLVRAAIDKSGKLFFPSRFTQAVLDDIKTQQGIDMFSAQYLNDPVPQGETASFHKEWFRYGVNKKCPLYILVDPAIGTEKGSDNTAIVLAGFDENNDLYVEKCVYGLFHSYQTINRIFSIFDAYRDRIKGLAIEVNAFQKLLKFSIVEQMKKRNKMMKVFELKHSKAKTERVLSLQPRYESQSVYHHPGMKNGKLEEELLKFPRGRSDDVVDALASLLEIVGPKKIKKKKVIDVRHRNLDEVTQGIINETRKMKARKPRFVTPTGGMF